MKKIFLFLIAGLLAFAFSFPASKGVQFSSNGWSQVSKDAKNQDKPIFVFVRTNTCNVSARMDEVFEQPNVSAFFNANFVNTQMNPEKTIDNLRVGNWGASSVPTYVFLNSNKKVIHKSTGFKSEAAMIKEAEKALKLMGIFDYKKGDVAKEKAKPATRKKSDEDEDEEDDE